MNSWRDWNPTYWLKVIVWTIVTRLFFFGRQYLVGIQRLTQEILSCPQSILIQLPSSSTTASVSSVIWQIVLLLFCSAFGSFFFLIYYTYSHYIQWYALFIFTFSWSWVSTVLVFIFSLKNFFVHQSVHPSSFSSHSNVCIRFLPFCYDSILQTASHTQLFMRLLFNKSLRVNYVVRFAGKYRNKPRNQDGTERTINCSDIIGKQTCLHDNVAVVLYISSCCIIFHYTVLF